MREYSLILIDINKNLAVVKRGAWDEIYFRKYASRVSVALTFNY